jgi:DNA modification methylase
MGAFYRSQTEFIAVFKFGDHPHQNNVELGANGRNRSNLWTYEGANSINPKRRQELALHPTVKPAQMVADAILDCTKRGDVVFDGFLGSGTTLIAAEDTGRTCYACEISPTYVDVAIRRWQEFTGGAAIHLDTGLTFDELAISRRRLITSTGQEGA